MRNWEGPKLLVSLGFWQGLPLLPRKPWTQTALEKAWYGETEAVPDSRAPQVGLEVEERPPDSCF